MLGVDGVALARQTPLALAGRAVHLLDGQPVAAQEAGQPDAVGAGSLDSERDEPTLGPDVFSAKLEQDGEPSCGCRDEQFAEPAAETVEQNCDVFVFVGVDADDDIVAAQLHAGHGRGLLRRSRSEVPLVGRADRTAMGPGWVRLL